MSDCSDLIGLRYRLGADGTDGEIDCIHLVYRVLERLNIASPEFKPQWYESDWRPIARDILQWGHRIAVPQYDGDVVLFKQAPQAFGVTWQTGVLYINRQAERVAWCPTSSITNCHCFRSSAN